jgi:hypothetical protein
VTIPAGEGKKEFGDSEQTLDPNAELLTVLSYYAHAPVCVTPCIHDIADGGIATGSRGKIGCGSFPAHARSFF